MGKPYSIRERAGLFADEVFGYCQLLRAKEPSYLIIVNQLNHAAGSIGANLAEAKDGETKKDFIHKNCIALKEANESRYWLTRAWASEHSLRRTAEPLIQEAGELIAILTAIVVKAKSNPGRGNSDR
jgi:four helix bundle protein